VVFAVIRGGQSLFAFQTICDLLEINSEEIRAGLRSLRKQDLPSRRQHCVFPHAQVRQRVARRRVDEKWRRVSIRPMIGGTVVDKFRGRRVAMILADSDHESLRPLASNLVAV
jgi:hypothetical protein